MARTSCLIAAGPEQVFAVLADGWCYSNWVVGTSHVRAVEAEWPAAGSRLFHATGTWPVVFRDETQVQECVPDRRLVLVARGRPFGEARVEIELAPVAGGTEVQMEEHPVHGPAALLPGLVTGPPIVRRNIEALARLTALVERRTSP